MKDSVVRGELLLFLYRHRDEGAIAFGSSKEAILPPQGISRRDWHGAVAQLAEYGLIDWKPTEDRSGRGLLEGFASISEFGIKVIETGCEPPIRIAFDRDRTTAAKPQQQVASASAAEQAGVTEAMEKVIAAIEQADVSKREKNEARSLLRTLLTGRAAAKVLGAGARALRTKYLAEGKQWES
jgi:hypothetical protein